MKNISWDDVAVRGILVALAAAGPAAFPASVMVIRSLHNLAFTVIIPAAILLIGAAVLIRRSRFSRLAAAVRAGAIGGAVATLALELVRYSGFRLGFMPGNLPELMGVLLFDRFALGPSTASSLAGFAYHFWNGACLGVIFALGRFRLPNWWAVPYGIVVGIGFLLSPVVEALGVGLFGVNFGWHFAATVLTAHLAYGLALAGILSADWAPSDTAWSCSMPVQR
jgi:hypothetical protein